MYRKQLMYKVQYKCDMAFKEEPIQHFRLYKILALEKNAFC